MSYTDIIFHSAIILAAGLVFQPLGNQGLVWKTIELRFNIYTGPGFFIALLSIINGLLLLVLFREFNVHGTKRKIPLKEICCWCFRKRENCGSKLRRLGQDGELNQTAFAIEVFQFKFCCCFIFNDASVFSEAFLIYFDYRMQSLTVYYVRLYVLLFRKY